MLSAHVIWTFDIEDRLPREMSIKHRRKDVRSLLSKEGYVEQ